MNGEYQDPSIMCPFWSNSSEYNQIKCLKLIEFDDENKKKNYMKSYCKSREFIHCGLAKKVYEGMRVKKMKERDEKHAGIKFIDRICGIK